MKCTTSLLAVADMGVSRRFYETVLQQPALMNIEDINVVYPGFALQKDYAGLVGAEGFETTASGNDHELVFEEEDFDAFIVRLEKFDDIRYIHPVKQYPWMQRVVRFYDPDMHPIEVGESMESVIRSLSAEGLSVDEISQKTMFPTDYIGMVLSQA